MTTMLLISLVILKPLGPPTWVIHISQLGPSLEPLQCFAPDYDASSPSFCVLISNFGIFLGGKMQICRSGLGWLWIAGDFNTLEKRFAQFESSQMGLKPPTGIGLIGKFTGNHGKQPNIGVYQPKIGRVNPQNMYFYGLKGKESNTIIYL